MPRWDWRGRCYHFACMRWAASRTFRAAAGDNDSMLRLVEIRDLIGGQCWFDLHQYRMGAQGGFVMHWSRLVDAPIAAIILVVSAFTGKLATGETAALLEWDDAADGGGAGVYAESCARRRRRLGADAGAHHLHRGAPLRRPFFVPGNIDHHNVQLTLTLAAMTALIIGHSHVAGIAAGVACALMLAVGMETLPYVAVAGLTVSSGYLLGGRAEAAKAAGFGVGFAGVGFAAFLATVSAMPGSRRNATPTRSRNSRLDAIRTRPGSGGGFSGTRPQLRRKARRIAGARRRRCRPRRQLLSRYASPTLLSVVGPRLRA